jgi:hypothetical protein
MIRKSAREEILKKKNRPNSNNFKSSIDYGYNGNENGPKRPVSLIGVSTMGSPKKSTMDEINKRLNSYAESLPGNSQHKKPNPFLKLKSSVLHIDEIYVNSVPVDDGRLGESKVFKISFSKKKFVLEFDVIESMDSDEESMDEENKEENNIRLRLEIPFGKISEMNISSEKNEVSIDASDYKIYEMFQENPKKPVEWRDSKLENLIGETFEVQHAIDNIALKFTLFKDSTGKNLATRLSILNRLLAAGVSFFVDGRPQRPNIGSFSLNMGQKFLPSRQEMSNDIFC